MPPRLLKLSFLTLLLAALPLCAQDVSVGTPFVTDREGAPPVLPQFRNKETPAYPDRLLESDAIGCVLAGQYVDADGKMLVANILSSQAPFGDALERVTADWNFRPARRDGQPVSSFVWVMVIFNPASTYGRNATPRLLEARPWVYPEGWDEKKSGQVYVLATVGADGRVTQAVAETPIDDAQRAGIEAEVKTWRFAPARKDGRPVAAQARVPVFCVPAISLLDDGAVTRPPRVVHQVSPEYPLERRLARIHARVVLDFIVDTEGRVRRVQVAESTDPAFDQAAIDALLKWRFTPGIEDDVPVNTHLQVPMLFQIEDTPNGGYDAYTVSRGNHRTVPPEFRYDVAPKLEGAVQPVYPYELYQRDVHGKAEVAFVIGPTGRVTNAKVIHADQPGFAQATLAMLDAYRFEPALKNGRPCSALLRVTEVFSPMSDDLSLNYEDRRVARLLKENSRELVSLQDLDTVPRAVSQRSPEYPVVLTHKTDTGRVLIEFVIDRQGNVHWPRVVSATEAAFGYAAVQAIAQWKFTPPLKNGKPVDALAEIPLVFKMPGRPMADDIPAGG